MSFIKSLFPLMLFTVIQSCKPYQFQNSHNYSYYLIDGKNLKQVIRNSILNLNPIHHPKYLLGRMIKPSYNYDFFYTNKILELVQKNDTMKLFCFCGPENYYFKNFNFKKGEYFIDMQSDTTRSDLYKPPIRYGNKLNVQKKITNTVFLDFENISPHGTPKRDIVRVDKKFGDVQFRVLDFSDSLNINLLPMTKEEFLDKSFDPKKRH